MDDPRPSLDFLQVALGDLKNHCYPGIDPGLSIFPQKELASTLRHELILRDPEPIDDKITDTINLLLYRHSMHMGHTTAEDLMCISSTTPASDYGLTRDVVMRRGDARELVADVVINTVMPNLLECKDPLHPCINNYVQGQGNPRICNDCSIIREIQRESQEVGDVILTRGHRLPARYVLHTLGPHLNEGEITDEDCEKLAACYISCFDLIPEKDDIHNVSFCMLSMGRNNFPLEEATHTALGTVNQWLQYHGTDVIELVAPNIFEGADAKGYMQALENWVED